jgi:hypothetical protein
MAHAASPGVQNAVTGQLLSRGDVARRFGTSETSVRRAEKKGVLKPILVDGQHFFEERQVKTVKTLRMGRLADAPIDGALAAMVFEEIAAGKTGVQIVVKLHVPPDVVRKLQIDYAELNGQATRCCACSASALGESSVRAVCSRCVHKVRVEEQVEDGRTMVRAVVDDGDGGEASWGYVLKETFHER